MKKLMFAIPSVLLISASAHSADTFMLKLVDQLDESESYCLDVTGWADHLKLEDPLQAHTCKPNSPDQEYVVEGNTLKMPEYNRCLTASASGDMTLPGAALLMRACNDSNMQNFKLLSSGRIQLTGSNLCVAAGNESLEASGPSHVWRVASMQPCDSTDQKLITWVAE